ncbi:deoxyribose-phosphate aldolase [Plasmodium falciparum IGH-CR14]|uniref:Deoxyribose-phosphate aldolase n=1 Tax=Plasmodium falciparum IGH-CR14 TaxID=580059 RepID=A0A0L1I6H3_PLAFA|nr:deoxyribose-phosphate aldolase [Plasmodium falciparum IGH-CR14]
MANYAETFSAWTSICLTDHTLLGENDTEDDIRELCEESVESCPFAAAVWPKVACVINFPHGTDVVEKVLEDTKKVLEDGVDEIDLVINYKKVLQNVEEGLKEATELTKKVKNLMKEKVLKVIIETGELKNDELIIKTTLAVLEGNADFVKTSSGKVPVNATPGAVKAIIEAMKQYVEKNPQKKDKIGLKVAGGVGDLNSASYYILLARRFLSALACHPNNFRIGSSSLVPKLRKIIAQNPAV